MAKRQSGDASRTKRGFAKRLKAARISAGYETQIAMAERIGSEHETYRRWERAETEPPYFMLVRIGEAVGKSLDFLICGPDEPNS